MRCKICGKDVCSSCLVYLFSILDAGGHLLDRWDACSAQCVDTLVRKFEEVASPEAVPISEVQAINKIPLLMQRFMIDPRNKEWLGSYVIRVMRGKPFNISFGWVGDPSVTRGDLFWGRLVRAVRLVVVQHLITAGRFEDAAKLYEELGMYKEAGKIRARGSEIRIKKTEVSVDLNSLLGQLKEGGIVVIYRCPHCGGKLKVGKDTNIESLKHCEHCGAEIETVDLVDFLRTAMS